EEEEQEERCDECELDERLSLLGACCSKTFHGVFGGCVSSSGSSSQGRRSRSEEASLEGLRDRGELLADAGAERGQKSDTGNCDEHTDQGVLDEGLALVLVQAARHVGVDAIDEVGHFEFLPHLNW